MVPQIGSVRESDISVKKKMKLENVSKDANIALRHVALTVIQSAPNNQQLICNFSSNSQKKK